MGAPIGSGISLMSRRLVVAIAGATAAALLLVVLNIGLSPGSPALLRWMYAVWLEAITLQSEACLAPGRTVYGSYSAANLRVYGDRHFAMVGRVECRSPNTPPTQMEFLNEYDLVGFQLLPMGRLGYGEPPGGPGKYLDIGNLTGERLSSAASSADGPVTVFTVIVKDPSVAQVAFRMSTGRYEYEEPKSELVGVMTLGTEGVCEYIALDKTGQILERVDLSSLANVDPALKVGC
ncbi:MAG TPA: hypothetical protein PLC98_24620 [Anaerolineales bacterium]|nr:hypothetical protein [Anaerolineales bacterium]